MTSERTSPLAPLPSGEGKRRRNLDNLRGLSESEQNLESRANERAAIGPSPFGKAQGRLFDPLPNREREEGSGFFASL